MILYDITQLIYLIHLMLSMVYESPLHGQLSNMSLIFDQTHVTFWQYTWNVKKNPLASNVIVCYFLDEYHTDHIQSRRLIASFVLAHQESPTIIAVNRVTQGYLTKLEERL